MGKHKKNKVKKEKTQHVYRTLEQRKEEVRKIIDKLNDMTFVHFQVWWRLEYSTKWRSMHTLAVQKVFRSSMRE